MGKPSGEWSTKPDMRAECLTCGMQWKTPNALGISAIHARRQNHCVRVEVERTVVYDHDPDSPYASKTIE